MQIIYYKKTVNVKKIRRLFAMDKNQVVFEENSQIEIICQYSHFSGKSSSNVWKNFLN